MQAKPADTTVDAFLGGLVTLVQPRSGHRAGLDAALLQAVVPTDADGHAVDLGAGVGTVAFSAAARAPALRVTGIERDPALVALARLALARPENAGFADRVRMIAADAAAPRELRQALDLPDGCADWVLMNPPFNSPDRASVSPHPDRRAAHLAGPGALADWCRSAAGLLRPGGSLGLIYRAEAVAEVLEAFADRFGNVRLLPVHPSPHAAAKRIFARATKGSRAPLRLMPGLVLHGRAGAWTAEADAILRGRAHLSFEEEP